MENNLKVYEYYFEPESMPGIELISLVYEPATELIGVALGTEVEEIKFSAVDGEERVLVSPILVPNQMIFRKEFNAYVFASKETIKRLQQSFVKNGNQNNSNIEHKGDMLSGITFTQQWIVRDSKNDTINAYGFNNIPEGSWCVMAQLSQELWDDYVKSGKVKGFSVEGLLGIKRSDVKLSTEIEQTSNQPPFHDNCKCVSNSDGSIDTEPDVCDYCRELGGSSSTEYKRSTKKQIKIEQKINLNKMNKKTISEVVAEALRQVALAAEVASNLVEFKDIDGNSYYASELVIDAVVTDVDGNLVAEKEFVIEDVKYKTDVNGVIVEIEPVEKEEEVVEQADEEIVTEEVPETEDVKVLKDKIVEQEKMIAELEQKNIGLEAKLVELEAKSKEEVLALSKETPASIGIKDNAIALNSNIKIENETITEMLSRLRK